MGKKLAIKGHPTRGKEVIELLEMMGGTNPFSDGTVIGNKTTNCYYIFETAVTKYISWDYIGPEEIDKYEIFTLEEFLEKYPYKIGDKIPAVWGNLCTVKSMSWDKNYKTVMYGFEETVFVVRGDELYITNIINNHTEPTKMKNVLAELLEHIKTTPKEELEKEFKEIEEWSDVGPTIEEFMTFCESVNKYKYPTTYDDCYDEGNTELHFIYVDKHERDLYESFIQLIRCRNAYWKIAGERMGLGKPWEPDWNDHNQPKFGIHTVQNNIRPIALHVLKNLILVFPTEEIRDIFYDNFKDLIERCKVLL